MKIALVAGETSGDILGGRLMAAIREREPAARFVGVGGDAMLAEGLDAVAPLDRLMVNGLAAPLARLPSLLRLLAALRRRFLDEAADVMVGVDFNVFNLLLERGLRKRGMPTAHYVSPSVYFWRSGRVRRIARAADVVLALFPFEPPFYAEQNARAVFVGHPLADEIGLADGSEDARRAARETLGLPAGRTVIALLPGSRPGEIDALGALFLDTAALLRAGFAGALFIVPVPTPRVADKMRRLLARRPAPEVRLVDGQSRAVIAAADIVLAKSGTGTLETMLLRRPMVVTYRVGRITEWLVRRLQRPEQRAGFVALPNILAGRELVPELLQRDARPERLASAMIETHRRGRGDTDYLRECERWHRMLRRDGAARAAETVLALARGELPAVPRAEASSGEAGA